MILLIALIVALVAMPVGVVIYRSSFNWEILGVLLAILGLLGAITFGSLLIFRNTTHRLGIEDCRHWAEAYNRPVKFVDYDYWGWNCLTPNPAKPGTWISTSNLYLVNR